MRIQVVAQSPKQITSYLMEFEEILCIGKISEIDTVIRVGDDIYDTVHDMKGMMGELWTRYFVELPDVYSSYFETDRLYIMDREFCAMCSKKIDDRECQYIIA